MSGRPHSQPVPPPIPQPKLAVADVARWYRGTGLSRALSDEELERRTIEENAILEVTWNAALSPATTMAQLRLFFAIIRLGCRYTLRSDALYRALDELERAVEALERRPRNGS